MIILKKNRFQYRNNAYFAKKPLFHCSLTTDFFQSSYEKKIIGFKRFKGYTKIIHLSKTIEEIMGGFTKNTQYEIKKAQNENLEFIFNYQDYNLFSEFYNRFAEKKGGIKSNYNSNFYIRNKNIFILSACKYGQDILVLHSYLIDQNIGRVSLFQSASTFHDRDKEYRALAGRANRFLHYNDILHFKSLGFTIYDFGGYCLEPTNPVLKNINSFKDSFGGELLQEYNYISYVKYQMLMIYRKISYKNTTQDGT